MSLLDSAYLIFSMSNLSISGFKINSSKKQILEGYTFADEANKSHKLLEVIKT